MMLRLATRKLPKESNPVLLIRAASNGAHLKLLATPNLPDFPQFLKNIESRWKDKLMRRFERERYHGGKETESSENLPRYILSMFPYPSGRLHLGHVRIYTSGDILTRYSKLMIKNEEHSKDFTHVINPMGFDSFGLPAENAAKERGLSPAVWTNSNIRSMKQQLDDLALQFDWREATSNPSYYKWTQAIFLKLMEANLVYKSFAQVNWDPIDKTVLADEQVDEEGRSWRSGALVEKRNYRQWFIKVNAFANDIYEAKEVDPETWGDILAIQRNWIGEPCGWLFYLPVRRHDSNQRDTLPVFTKNPELFIKEGTKLIVSQDHWLEKVYNVSSSGHIENPFTGSPLSVVLTDRIEELPSSCSATIENTAKDLHVDIGLSRNQVLLKAKLHNLGGYYTSDKYRDWLISRQRFWGTPIPVIYCDNCGFNQVPKESLPVTLPKLTNLNDKLRTCEPKNHEVVSPLEELAPVDWLEPNCPSCGSRAKRECETLDTLFDSSWYFLRYATEPISDKPFDSNRVQPVWCYSGGKEHASMHLFYARFMTHFLNSQKELRFKEPFSRLLVQGVVKSKTYKMKGRYLSTSEVQAIEDITELDVEYEKMSKSKGNGVDPQELLDRFGIDATRFCLMSYANPRTERLWRDNDTEFKEVLVFMRRVALTVEDYIKVGDLLRGKREDKTNIQLKELDDDELNKKKRLLDEVRNRCAIDATYYIQETYQFRQYISVLHTLLSSIRSNLTNSVIYTREFAETLAALIIMLNPLTPHFSEELWFHFSKCIINPLTMEPNSPYKIDLQASDQAWPTPDSNYPLAVKVRATNSDEYIDRISISKDMLKNSSTTDITKLVESHYESKDDRCRVIEVKKYNDLMAIVLADVESANKKKAEKKRKKKNSDDGSRCK